MATVAVLDAYNARLNREIASLRTLVADLPWGLNQAGPDLRAALDALERAYYTAQTQRNAWED